MFLLKDRLIAKFVLFLVINHIISDSSLFISTLVVAALEAFTFLIFLTMARIIKMLTNIPRGIVMYANSAIIAHIDENIAGINYYNKD